MNETSACGRLTLTLTSALRINGRAEIVTVICISSNLMPFNVFTMISMLAYIKCQCEKTKLIKFWKPRVFNTKLKEPPCCSDLCESEGTYKYRKYPLVAWRWSMTGKKRLSPAQLEQRKIFIRASASETQTLSFLCTSRITLWGKQVEKHKYLFCVS